MRTLFTVMAALMMSMPSMAAIQPTWCAWIDVKAGNIQPPYPAMGMVVKTLKAEATSRNMQFVNRGRYNGCYQTATLADVVVTHKSTGSDSISTTIFVTQKLNGEKKTVKKTQSLSKKSIKKDFKQLVNSVFNELHQAPGEKTAAR